MQLAIEQVKELKLTGIIQYYIFCTSSGAGPIHYQTFPNTNLCLSVYKSNQVTYDRIGNFCRIKDGSSPYCSRLWGFHTKPFRVNIQGAIDQVCILFYPGGLRNFTSIPYETLRNTDNVLEVLFGEEGKFLAERLFETNNTGKRIQVLEQFLSGRMAGLQEKNIIGWALQHIAKHQGNVKVEKLSEKLGINDSTLYKRFMNVVGQSPKEFIKTVRFRAALELIKKQQKIMLTDIGYAIDYYDQSHFIKEFLQLTEYTPKEIRKNAVVEQEKLIWMTNFR